MLKFLFIQWTLNIQESFNYSKHLVDNFYTAETTVGPKDTKQRKLLLQLVGREILNYSQASGRESEKGLQQTHDERWRTD